MNIYVVLQMSYQHCVVDKVFRSMKNAEEYCANHNADITKNTIWSFVECELE